MMQEKNAVIGGEGKPHTHTHVVAIAPLQLLQIRICTKTVAQSMEA